MATRSPNPDPKIIDGKFISEQVLDELTADISSLKAKHNLVPGLAVVLVGERKDSQTYVRMKQKAAEKCGMKSVVETLSEKITQEELLNVVQRLNKDKDIHGIIVQLPLPPHIDEEKVLNEVCLEKDVDGFSPENIGRLGMRGREPFFVSCTPRGCMELLHRYNIPIEGKKAVVLGRSNIVGLPIALLLNNANATVTICHSKTPNLENECKTADIVIAAIGKPLFVKGSWIKEGAVVIDVGINAVDDPSSAKGYKLVGDVAFDEVKPIASKITPVPNGVGPMTVAMLLSNTVIGFKRQLPK